MRNLKKMLSLVMALAMVASFMVVGASANFSDDDAIKNTDAVNTLVALGVIKGYDTGDFKPEGIVTRAEMAKMICVAINGGNDPKLGNTVSKFTDVPAAHWASGYIDFCVNMGILAGYQDGTFKPDATVTGTEAAKMLLILIGYDAANSNLVGAQWDTNTNAQANLRGFFKDLAINPSQGLTRDSAAQMIFNAVEATMVKYDYKLTTVNGVLTTLPVVIDNTDAKNTILETKFDVVTDEYAMLTGVIPVTTGVNKGTFGLSIDTDAAAEYTKVTGDYTALLGQSIKVLHKAGKSDAVYGVYATDENTVVTSAQSVITDGGSNKVKFDDTKYELAAACKTIVDGVYSDTTRAAAYFVDAESYNNISFVDNNADNKYEVAVVTTVNPAKVTYVSSTEIIAGGETYKYADENIAEDLAKGDYVTVVKNIAQDKNDIELIEAVKGTVEATKTGPKIQIDGIWYRDAAATGLSAGDDATVYAVNGVIYAGDKTSSATLSDVVLVTIEDGTVRTEAKYINADGTVKTVVVDTAKSEYVPAAGKLYTVKEASNGYRFTEVTEDVGNFKWQSGLAIDTTGTIDTIGSKNIDDNATILVMGKSDGGCKVLTGKQFKTLTATATDNDSNVNSTALGAFTSKVGGLERITFAAVKMNKNAGLPDVGNAKENYALVVSDAVTVKDGTKYDIWDGSAKITVTDEDSNDLAEGNVIIYSAVDGSTIKDVELVDPATALTTNDIANVSIRGISGDFLWLNGQDDATHKYEIVKDTVIMYYDSADMVGKGGGEIQLADEVDGQYIENAKAVVSTGDKEILFLLVDVKNKLDDATTYDLTITEGSDRLASMVVTNVDGDVVEAGTDKVKAGDILTVTMTGAATAGDVTVTLTNGVIAGGSLTTKDYTVANEGTVKFQVVAGADDLTIAAANKT